MLIFSIVLLIISVILDQVTKYLAVVYLKPIDVHPLIPGVIELNFETNEGIAWGMLQGKWWIFVPLSLIAVGAILYFLIRYRRQTPPLLSVALAMIAGGGIGNQIDRILNQSVVDFLNFQFIDFPVFNVADCFVTVGCFLAIFDLLFFHRDFFLDDPEAKKEPPPADGKTTPEKAEEPLNDTVEVSSAEEPSKEENHSSETEETAS